MATSQKINLGIVGVGGRGGGFNRATGPIDSIRIHAVCDTDAERLEEAAGSLGASEAFADYGEMLASPDLEAVLIGTPMPYHAAQAIAALDRGIHVLSEVPAAVSVEECRRIVEASKRSSAIYMMAENYCYMRPNQIVRQMVSEGVFGKPYYAEGEYIHELKPLNEVTKWRRRWQTGIDGITYGTHSLGPILQWMPGDRVTSVCCAGSGYNHVDPRGDPYENQASCVMLCKMASGGLVKIRVDMISDRPLASTNYQLQGVDGCYESARAQGEKNRVWLRSYDPDSNSWMDLEDLAERFTPPLWQEYGQMAEGVGHGGGDMMQMMDFVAAIREGSEPPIGVHEAMDMTLPGLLSQQSIREGGRWLDVPDSRAW